MKLKVKKISNIQLNKKLEELLFKVEMLQNCIIEIEKRLPNKQLKYLRFEECVPPKDICVSINSMMDGVSNYVGFLGKLSEYYSCSPMGLYVDKSINAKHIAEYRPDDKNAYSKESTCDKDIVLHEFFHHLVNLKVIVVNEKEEEKLADKYAKIFLKRAGCS